MSFVLLPYVVQLLYHITRSRLCQQLFYFFKLFVSTLFRFHATALICYHTLKSLSTLFLFFSTLLWVSAVPSRDSFDIISLIQRPVNTLFYFFIKKVRTPSIFPEGPHFYPVKTAFFPYLIMSPEDNYDRIASSVKDCGWSDRKSIPPVLSRKTPLQQYTISKAGSTHGQRQKPHRQGR